MEYQCKFEHLNCGDCADLGSKSRCPHQYCPHILDNLEELKDDSEFRSAVRNARECTSFHRETLRMIRGWWGQ